MLAPGSGLHGRVMLGFDMVLYTWTWGRCELGRRFEQLTPVYIQEKHIFVLMQGVIWPSPDSRTWDLRAQDALMLLLAGLLSEGKQMGKNCPGCLCACPGLSASCVCSSGGFQPLPWVQTGFQDPTLCCPNQCPAQPGAVAGPACKVTRVGSKHRQRDK